MRIGNGSLIWMFVKCGNALYREFDEEPIILFYSGSEYESLYH